MRFPTRMHITVSQGLRRMGDLGERQDKAQQLPECVPSIIPRLEHEFCGQSDRVSVHHPRQDRPHEDGNSQNAEEHEGHRRARPDSHLLDGNAHTWPRGRSVRPLRDGLLARGFEFHNLINMSGSASTGETPREGVEGSFPDATTELVLRSSHAWKIEVHVIDS